MEIETLEDIIARHKQEKKDLQSKVQALKKGVPKGDKKRKKEVADQITQIEQDLENKHAEELKSLPQSEAKEEEENSSIIEENQDDSVDQEPPRATRAQKRRNKKAIAEKERDKRISEQSLKNRDGPRVREMNTINEVLRKMNLGLYDIAADGNCLYCAIGHQLEAKDLESYGVNKLRKLAADFMRENKDDFLPFMYNDSGEPVSETYFENYCKEVANTKLWGGQLELRALSNVLKCPIKIIQASGPPTIQGENFSGPELILTYHRHLYRLGEHYNSTVVLSSNEEPQEENNF